MIYSGPSAWGIKEKEQSLGEDGHAHGWAHVSCTVKTNGRLL